MSLGIGGATVGVACGCQIPGFPNTPPAGCTIANATGCTAGMDLQITEKDANADGAFFVNCNTNILTYATNYARGVNGVDYTRTGSGYPVRISVNFTVGTATSKPLINIGNCTGDTSSTTIDAILCTQGDGRTTGTHDDAIKGNGNTGPNGLEVVSRPGVCTNVGGTGGGTGGINCGQRLSTSHQDGVQDQTVTNLRFYDSYIGDYNNLLATCSGDGGGFFLTLLAPSGYMTGVAWVRGHSDTCNKGLNSNVASGYSGNIANATGTVSDSVFRAGNPADLTAGVCNAQVGAIDSSGSNYASGLATVQAKVPSVVFSNITGDFWCQTGASSWCVSQGGPGYNPANN